MDGSGFDAHFGVCDSSPLVVGLRVGKGVSKEKEFYLSSLQHLTTIKAAYSRRMTTYRGATDKNRQNSHHMTSHEAAQPLTVL